MSSRVVLVPNSESQLALHPKRGKVKLKFLIVNLEQCDFLQTTSNVEKLYTVENHFSSRLRILDHYLKIRLPKFCHFARKSMPTIQALSSQMKGTIMTKRFRGICWHLAQPSKLTREQRGTTGSYGSRTRSQTPLMAAIGAAGELPYPIFGFLWTFSVCAWLSLSCQWHGLQVASIDERQVRTSARREREWLGEGKSESETSGQSGRKWQRNDYLLRKHGERTRRPSRERREEEGEGALGNHVWSVHLGRLFFFFFFKEDIFPFALSFKGETPMYPSVIKDFTLLVYSLI